MTLLPVLSPLEDESLTSFLNRVAAFHFGIGVREFLSSIELSQQSVLYPDDEALDRIARLTGTSVDHLKSMTFLREGARMRSFRGQIVHAEFGNLNATSFCPACLLEDGQCGSASQRRRVGRSIWQIEPVRQCPKYGLVLHRRGNTSHSEKFQLMDEVAPNDEELQHMVDSAMHLPISGLSDWVLSRLRGEKGPEWLDCQPIDLAARACEMLGVILSVGTHVNLRKITSAQWAKAGHLGFGYASRGEQGIREALDLAYQDFTSKEINGGPQQVLGRLYQWLQFSKNDKPFGPIREVVRDFILDHFAIAKGTELLGRPVERQRVHTAHSLARKTGQHSKTVNRAMVLAGVMRGDPEKVSGTRVFDAEMGEALMSRIRNSIPIKHLPNYLNCNRVQAEQLTRTGIIPSLVQNDGNLTGVLKNVALEDADTFLKKLTARAVRVQVPSDGVMDIVSAAEAARWPVIDIVRGLLGGVFETVEVVDPDLKFKGILIDPTEVRAVLTREKAEGRVELEEAARIIGMPPHGLSALARMRKPCGAAYVTEHFVENSKGKRIRLFALEELLQFRKEHISLTEIAQTEHFSTKVMKMKMDGRGIEPVAPKYELGRIWYRRENCRLQ